MSDGVDVEEYSISSFWTKPKYNCVKIDVFETVKDAQNKIYKY